MTVGPETATAVPKSALAVPSDGVSSAVWAALTHPPAGSVHK